MAKIKISGNPKEQLDKIVESITKELNDKGSESFLKPFAIKILDIIYKRVKIGKGVTSATSKTATLEPLKKLSKSYRDARAGKVAFYKKDGNLLAFDPKGKINFTPGKFFSPNKSNLTRTGQMLEAFAYKISKGTITAFVKDSPRDDDLTNAEVAKIVSDNKRQFFNLAVEEQKIVTTMIEKEVRKIIRRKFGKGA